MTDENNNLIGGHSVPDLARLHRVGLPRHPKLDAMRFLNAPRARTPHAAPCLNDSYYMLCEARYALEEGLKQVRRNLAAEPPDEWRAAFFGQFYGADVTLRLYAAGEHLANAIVEILDVDKRALDRFRKNGRSSLQAIVAKFLETEAPRHPISAAVGDLGSSNDWKRSMRYRNDWVHEQAPQVRGLGLQFKRGEEYWREVNDPGGTGYEIGFGSQPAPDLPVDELLEFASGAARVFTEALAAVAANYQAQLPGG